MTTVTVDRPTVRVRDLARALGLAPLEGDLVAHATALGVELEVGKDWSGQPAVTEANAAELVAVTERRGVEQRQAKRRRQWEIETARAALDAAVGKAARTAYREVFDREVRAGRLATAELAAWTAAVQAGLDVQDAAAAPAVAKPAPPRRWWRR
jgi:hypothetical protein